MSRLVVVLGVRFWLASLEIWLPTTQTVKQSTHKRENMSTPRRVCLGCIYIATAAASPQRLGETKVALVPSEAAVRHFDRVHGTAWHRALLAASSHVARRERTRSRDLRRRSGDENVSEGDSNPTSGASDIRDLQYQVDNYSDYIPEDDPEATHPQHYEDGSTLPPPSCMSPLQKWFVTRIDSIGLDTWETMLAYNITSLSYLYKHHVSGADGSAEYFGAHGERNEEMLENHASMQSFWTQADSQHVSVQYEAAGFHSVSNPHRMGGPGNVILLGMHGTDLADKAKLVPTLQQIYRLDGADAYNIAASIQGIVKGLPDGFNNPVLTANAIATQTMKMDGSRGERDSIIVGDGVYDFLEYLGLENDGTSYIHSHEFSHHLQYDLGVDQMSAETRRWEMMADALGSYFLSHTLGGRMDQARLLEVHRAAFSLGDCEDSIDTHHGTPRQRECASNFGSNLGFVSFVDGGHMIPPAELMLKFEKNYPSVLQLDDGQCRPAVNLDLLDKAIYGEMFERPNDSSREFIDEKETNFLQTPISLDSPTREDPSWDNWDSHDTGNSWGQGSWTTHNSFQPYTIEASPKNELDKPPEIVPGGGAAVDEEEGWFGPAHSAQWTYTPRSSSGMNSSVGSAWLSAFSALLLSATLTR